MTSGLGASNLDATSFTSRSALIIPRDQSVAAFSEITGLLPKQAERGRLVRLNRGGLLSPNPSFMQLPVGKGVAWISHRHPIVVYGFGRTRRPLSNRSNSCAARNTQLAVSSGTW